jgi:hypothetical protein
MNVVLQSDEDRKCGIINRQLSVADYNGGLAQLARAPDLHSGGQGFDSLILHKRVSRVT